MITRLIAALVLCLTVSDLLPGCTAHQGKDGAHAAVTVAGGASAVLKAEASYEAAKIAIEDQAQKFPPDVQTRLREIGDEADTLIRIAKHKIRFRSIYRSGRGLVAPYRV